MTRFAFEIGTLERPTLSESRCLDTPINVVGVAYEMGIHVCETELSFHIRSALLRHERKVFIVLNRHETPPGKRFETAYQLGQLAYHQNIIRFAENVHKRTIPSHTHEYSWVTQYARELLIPAHLARSHHNYTPEIWKLALTFGVTYTVMKTRLNELGIC